MTFQDRVFQEIFKSMGTVDQDDVAFFGFWITRREDGTLSPAIFKIEDKVLSYEEREELANALHRMAYEIGSGK